MAGSAWRPRRGLLLAAAGALALILLAFVEVPPGSGWGIGFGIAAGVLLLAAALFGIRRRTVRAAARWRLGRSSAWLTVHLYGSVLFLVLMLLHTGVRLPQGVLGWALWALSLWTVASGLIGLGLQRWIPRALTSGLSLEVLYERIPELVAEIGQRAEALAAEAGGPVQALYGRQLAPALAGPRRELIYFLDVTGGSRSRLREIDYLRRLLPAEEKEKLGEIERLYRAKLEMDAHYTLQPALRWWLFAHVPPSLILLGLAFVHLFSVLYY